MRRVYPDKRRRSFGIKGLTLFVGRCRIVKSMASAQDPTGIRKILTILQDGALILSLARLLKRISHGRQEESPAHVTMFPDFAFSSNANFRKGGLIGLAAIAIALGQFPDSIATFLPELAPPVLGYALILCILCAPEIARPDIHVSRCFTDVDARVRYYACEAMYNISKVARLEVLSFFNRLFVGLYKLTSDADPSVKNGAELLDRLIKVPASTTTSMALATTLTLSGARRTLSTRTRARLTWRRFSRWFRTAFTPKIPTIGCSSSLGSKCSRQCQI